MCPFLAIYQPRRANRPIRAKYFGELTQRAQRCTKERHGKRGILYPFVSRCDVWVRSYRKIETALPTVTSSFTRAASQLACQFQPPIGPRPIVSGLFVP